MNCIIICHLRVIWLSFISDAFKPKLSNNQMNWFLMLTKWRPPNANCRLVSTGRVCERERDRERELERERERERENARRSVRHSHWNKPVCLWGKFISSHPWTKCNAKCYMNKASSWSNVTILFHTTFISIILCYCKCSFPVCADL